MRNASGRTEWTVRDFFTRQKGWIYIDVMIATVMLLICAGAIMASYRQMTLEGIFSKSYQYATFLAKNEIERVRFEEAKNANGLTITGENNVFEIPSPPSTDGKVQYILRWESIKQVPGTPDLRDCTVAVTWQDAGAKQPTTIRSSTSFRVIEP